GPVGGAGVSGGVVNWPVMKPLASQTILDVASRVGAVVTAENHTIVGGLGTAVAETLAEAGAGVPLRRVGLADTFAEGARTGPWLFRKYGLTTQDVVDAAWQALGRSDPPPVAETVPSSEGEYAPV